MPTDPDLTMRIAALEQKVADLYKRVGASEPGNSWDGGDSGFGNDPEQDPGVIALVQKGRTIEAIKVYRELSGAGLKQAKKAVERMAQLHPPTG